MNCIGAVRISDYFTFNANSVAVAKGVGLAFTSHDRNLYGQLVVRGALNPDAATDIQVKIVVVID